MRTGLDRARAACARGQQEHRVVCARVAVDAELVPRPGDDRPEQPVEDRRLDGGVGQDHRQHRRHPRMDHPDALGDPGYPDGAAAVAVGVREHEARRRQLGPRIGRAQGDCRCLEGIVGGRQGRAESDDPGLDQVEREAGADDPGREQERPVDDRAGGRGEQLGDTRLVGLAGGPGRSIGAAARRDDRLGPAVAAGTPRRRRGQMVP